MIHLSDDLQNDLNKSSSIVRIAYKLLKQAMTQLITGECSDDEIYDVIDKLDIDKKYSYNPNDFCTLDEAMKLLKFGQNRVGCLNHLKKNNIHCYHFNNQPIGYKKSEVLSSLKI